MTSLRPAARPAIPALPVLVASGLLALAGLGISIYLTIAHYVGTQILACVSNSAINCELVTTSAQSHFLGMPVSVLGLAYYAVAVVLYSPWAWWSSWRPLHLARIVGAVGGMCFVLWLLSAELVIIHKICLWCTAVHIVTFALFVLTLTSAPSLLAREDLSA
jgi:uncharacterized membrane protein